MPEPVTVTVVGVTVVTLAHYAYRIAKEIINVPKAGVKQAGESVQELVQTVGAELRQTFNAQPVITINRVVIQQAPQRICEWCFAKQVVEVREKLQHKWLFSEKHYEISQAFVLKAGFDLNRIRLEFHEKSREVRLVISDATIVNVEHHSPYKWDRQEDGWWNRISNAERDNLVNSLPEKAKSDASKRELTTIAAEELTVVLGAFFKRIGCELKVVSENHNLHLKNAGSLPEIPEDRLAALGIAQEAEDMK